jgi:hypothetical protein
VTLDPEFDVADHAAEEVVLLRAAMAELEGALDCDAHLEEVSSACEWAQRVETSAWALRRKLESLT